MNPPKRKLGKEDLRHKRLRALRGDRELRDDIAVPFFDDGTCDCAPDEDSFHPRFRQATDNGRNR